MESLFQGRYLSYRTEGPVGLVAISNPPVNAFPGGLVDEMGCLQQQIDTSSIGAILIYSEGSYFSAGVDLKSLGEFDSSSVAEKLPRSHAVFDFWQAVNVPVVVAVQRLCLGLGMELMLCSDVCAASTGARFAMPEVRFGLAPDMGGTARLTRLAGPRAAKKLLLCGEELTAEEMQAIGLVEYVVEEEDLFVFARQLAERLAAKPRWALTFAKKGINAAAEGGLQAGLLFEQVQSAFCCGTLEKDAAVAAFFEKRLASSSVLT